MFSQLGDYRSAPEWRSSFLCSPAVCCNGLNHYGTLTLQLHHHSPLSLVTSRKSLDKAQRSCPCTTNCTPYAIRSVSMYALQFRTLAATSGWNETALITAFRQGLNPNIRQLMVIYDDAMELENLIQKTIRVAQRFSACKFTNPSAKPLPTVPSVTLPAPESVQVDSYRLTRAERHRRILNHLCLYCGGEGHVIAACPVRPPCPVVSSLLYSYTSDRSFNQNFCTHPNPTYLCFSASPHRLQFCRELHQLPNPPKTERETETLLPKPQDTNHPRKAAGS